MATLIVVDGIADDDSNRGLDHRSRAMFQGKRESDKETKMRSRALAVVLDAGQSLRVDKRCC